MVLISRSVPVRRMRGKQKGKRVEEIGAMVSGRHTLTNPEPSAVLGTHKTKKSVIVIERNGTGSLCSQFALSRILGKFCAYTRQQASKWERETDVFLRSSITYEP